MKLRPKIALIDHFANLTDPRIERTKEHKLIDILTIAICAVICGADTWIGIETYGRAKYQWLEQFLEKIMLGFVEITLLKILLDCVTSPSIFLVRKRLL